MTAILVLAVAFLAWLCIVLALLLVGRHRGANREEARLRRIGTDLEEQYAAERAKTRHLTERVAEYRTELARLSAENGRLIADNAGLTDALDAITGEPSLTESVYADLAELDITYPGDPR